MDRTAIRERVQQFLRDVVALREPAVIADELTAMGFMGRKGEGYTAGAVRAWKAGNFPPPDVVFALARWLGLSLDQYVHGEALEAKYADQAEKFAKRLTELEEAHDALLRWALSKEDFVQSTRTRDPGLAERLGA